MKNLFILLVLLVSTMVVWAGKSDLGSSESELSFKYTGKPAKPRPPSDNPVVASFKYKEMSITATFIKDRCVRIVYRKPTAMKDRDEWAKLTDKILAANLDKARMWKKDKEQTKTIIGGVVTVLSTTYLRDDRTAQATVTATSVELIISDGDSKSSNYKF